jgi:photosystem II stability/assembly factor-like uncharacterized protein
VRFRGVAFVVSGAVAAAALGATLAAAQGPGVAPVASFRVTLLHPLIPTDPKTDRVALDITNTGGAAGWPKCKVVATMGSGLRRGAISYWSTSKVRPGETVRTRVRLTIVNGGVRGLSSRDVVARCHSALGPGPLPPPKPHAVVPAVAPAALPPRDVGSLEMLTPSAGVALAGTAEPGGLPGPAYLVSTADGGTTWSVTGTLPVRLTRDGLVTAGLAFESRRAGYVETYDGPERRGVVYFTSDGGAAWQKVTTPDDTTGISLADGSLWSVGEVCATPTLRPQSCKSQLLVYRFGALRPTRIASIPVLTQRFGGAPRLLERLGATSGIFAGQGTTPKGLAVTTDAGGSWQALDSPCGGLPAEGLVVTAPGSWLLLCEISGGMENYVVRLYRTDDAGAGWQLVAERNVTQSLPQIGNIGGGFHLSVSGDGHVIWDVGVLGGVSWSLDGGSDWTGSYPITTGGAPVDLATAGATDAWVANTWNGLYATNNGTTWHSLT